jgi:hypothetical protein
LKAKKDGRIRFAAENPEESEGASWESPVHGWGQVQPMLKFWPSNSERVVVTCIQDLLMVSGSRAVPNLKASLFVHTVLLRI